MKRSSLILAQQQQQQQQQRLFKHDKNYSGADVVVYLKVKHSLQMNKKLKN